MGRVCTNIFDNNEQKITSQYARKDQIKNFLKKTNKEWLKHIDKHGTFSTVFLFLLYVKLIFS